MDLTPLLRFIPLIVGVFLAYHLIFKQQLPSKSLGAIATYFIGIVIVFLAVGWLISQFLPGFFNDLLNVGITSNEWQQVIDNSEGIIEDAFDTSSSPPPAPTATPIPLQTNQTNNQTAPQSNNGGSSNDTAFGAESAGERSGPIQYTVVAGDTLYGIAQRYNSTVDDIMIANGLSSTVIQKGQVLVIPAPR